MTAEPGISHIDDEEAYNSASDEDFNPAAEPDEVGSSSSDEDEHGPVTAKALKQKRKARIASPEAELESGDEATIQELRRSRKRRGDGTSDDEGGEGGLIKTRAQRRMEEKERRPLARTDGATVDVDALWATLASAPVGRLPETQLDNRDKHVANGTDAVTAESGGDGVNTGAMQEMAVDANPDEEYITIKRTYDFAGKVHSEERRVLKSSAEARLYLASQAASRSKIPDSNTATDAEQPSSDTPVTPALRRPLKRPSRFEPNPSGVVTGLPEKLQLRWPRVTHSEGTVTSRLQSQLPKAPTKTLQATKLNTVDKSRIDWAGYVDKEGIAEELGEYGRSKTAYGSRMEFLNRVGQREEEERRAGRVR